MSDHVKEFISISIQFENIQTLQYITDDLSEVLFSNKKAYNDLFWYKT